MFHFDYTTTGTCSRIISVDLDGDSVHNVSFQGGCNGNLKAISTLVEGKTVSEIEEMLKGIECGSRGTSCSDQLAHAVRAALSARESA